MLSPDEIIIREYREGDEVQINLLHNEEYGTSRRAEEWRWEFRDGSCDGSIFVVAEYRGEIIGTQALLPTLLSYGVKEVLCAKSEATLLKKEFRGQGLFKRLYDKCFELAYPRGIALIYGFTYADRAFTNVGFQVPGKLRRFVLILDPAQTYQINKGRIPAGVKRRLPFQVGQKFLLRAFALVGFFWFKTRRRKMNPSSRFTVAPITQADERLDTFWEAFRQKAGFYTIARTSNYLDWRIFRNPNRTSQLLAVVENNGIKGYITLDKSKQVNMGFITDLCVLDDHFEEVAALLISHAVEYFRSQGIAFVDAWRVGNNPELKRYLHGLRRFGFISLPLGSYFVLKVLATKEIFPVEPSDLNQWFITELFSEGVG